MGIIKELIKEFIEDLESIDSWQDDYGDYLANGDQLDKVITKWKSKEGT